MASWPCFVSRLPTINFKGYQAKKLQQLTVNHQREALLSHSTSKSAPRFQCLSCPQHGWLQHHPLRQPCFLFWYGFESRPGPLVLPRDQCWGRCLFTRPSFPLQFQAVPQDSGTVFEIISKNWSLSQDRYLENIAGFLFTDSL